MLKRKIIYKPSSSHTHIKERPLAFFDLEFSGLNFDNEILEIGCIIADPKTLKVKKEWFAKVKPDRIDLADKNSLKMIEYSEKEWREALTPKKALKKFNTITRGAVLVGYNPYWDFMFLMKSFWQENIKVAFHWQIIDVLPIAFAKLYNSKKIKDFRLYEVVKFLRVEKGDKHHNALDDARMTYKVFMKLIKNGK